MRAAGAILLALLLAGCGKSEPPVALAPAYMDVVVAAFAVSACEAAGDIRQKNELISERAAIGGRISAQYGAEVLLGLKAKEAGLVVVTDDPCPGDQGFRKYREAVAALSKIVG